MSRGRPKLSDEERERRERERRLKNKESGYMKTYYQNNKEKYAEFSRREYAKKKQTMAALDSERRQLFEILDNQAFEAIVSSLFAM
jgi:hypothetical protein